MRLDLKILPPLIFYRQNIRAHCSILRTSFLLPTPVFYTYIFSFNSLCIFSSLSAGHSLFPFSVRLIHCLLKVLMDNYMDLNHEDRIVSYLPLSHIAAQLIDIHAPMKLGATTYFCQVMPQCHNCSDRCFERFPSGKLSEH